MSTALQVYESDEEAPLPVRASEAQNTAVAAFTGAASAEEFAAIVKMAEMLVPTGMLPDHIKTPGQAVAIILTGRELGMQPMRAIRSLQLVKGKVTENADSQLARFKSDGGRSRWEELNEKRAVLWLRHPNGDEHTETFTYDDAERAGLTKPSSKGEASNYQKHPVAMLRSRAITAGLKSIGWEGGAGAYDPDELRGVADGTNLPTVGLHESASGAVAVPAANEPEAKCPKCGGKMWDNRAGKRSEKAPDFKCRDKGCDGVYWPGQWPPVEKPAAAPEQVEAIRTHIGQPYLTAKQSRGMEQRLARGMDQHEAHEALEFCLARQAEYVKENAEANRDQGGLDLSNEGAEEDADLAAHTGGAAPGPRSATPPSRNSSTKSSGVASETSSATNGAAGTTTNIKPAGDPIQSSGEWPPVTAKSSKAMLEGASPSQLGRRIDDLLRHPACVGATDRVREQLKAPKSTKDLRNLVEMLEAMVQGQRNADLKARGKKPDPAVETAAASQPQKDQDDDLPF